MYVETAVEEDLSKPTMRTLQEPYIPLHPPELVTEEQSAAVIPTPQRARRKRIVVGVIAAVLLCVAIVATVVITSRQPDPFPSVCGICSGLSG